MLKTVTVIVFAACACLAQTRPTPLSNPYFRTDGDLAYNSLTNAKSIVFKGDGTNVTVDASTFLTLFNGEAVKLMDGQNQLQYLVVSNGVPYVITTNGIKTVTLNNDTTFIRQGEFQANVTNLTVHSELILDNPSGVDDSQYVVTEASLTNGAILKLNINNFLLFVTNGVLTAKDLGTGNSYPLAP